jgi:hypothetical protein
MRSASEIDAALGIGPAYHLEDTDIRGTPAVQRRIVGLHGRVYRLEKL